MLPDADAVDAAACNACEDVKQTRARRGERSRPSLALLARLSQHAQRLQGKQEPAGSSGSCGSSTIINSSSSSISDEDDDDDDDSMDSDYGQSSELSSGFVDLVTEEEGEEESRSRKRKCKGSEGSETRRVRGGLRPETIAWQRHQTAAVAAFTAYRKQEGSGDGHRNMVLHVVPGGGKTLTALECARRLFLLQDDEDGIDRVVIAVTKSTAAQWAREARRWLPRGTYTIVGHHEAFAGPESVGELQLGSSTLLIVDEAHEFRNCPAASLRSDEEGGFRGRSAYMVDSCSLAGRVILLTGTIFFNGCRDFRNIAGVMRGLTWDETVAEYWQPDGSAEDDADGADDAAMDVVAEHMLHFQPREPLPRMPSLVRHDVPLLMSDSYRKEYDDVRNQTVGGTHNSLFSGAKNLRNFRNGTRRAANKLTEGEQGHKLDWLTAPDRAPAWVRNGEKFAVYSEFLKCGADAAHDALVRNRILRPDQISTVNGRMSVRARQRALDRFNRGETAAFVFSGAAAMGIDLKGVRHLVLLEQYWNAAKIDQVIARAQRVMSHEHLPPDQRTVDVWHLRLRRADLPALPEDERERPSDRVAAELSADDLLFLDARRKRALYERRVRPFLEAQSIAW